MRVVTAGEGGGVRVVTCERGSQGDATGDVRSWGAGRYAHEGMGRGVDAGHGATSSWGGVGLEGLRPRLTVTAGAGGETLDWGAAG
ncbi:hypothetical protein HRbin28_00167 [bacterium HR28]|nr:hypothetical protein HRbin28_00167 [bacterium HR28]